MRRLICLLTIAAFLPAKAAISDSIPTPENPREVARSYLFGIGQSSQLDTYLSPLNYKGVQVSFLSRIDRQTHWAGGRLHYQGTFQGAFTNVKDRLKMNEEWGAHVGYDAGWHYHWTPSQHWTLMAGGLIGTDLGFLYNTNGGNNPAQARFNIDISLSAGATYHLRIRKTTLPISYQADLPLMGIMFSPQFGQSYYELSRGNRDHNVCFTYPINAFSLRQMLWVDVPFRYFDLRAGYLWDVRQSHVNSIRVHDISHSFLLGFVKHFSIIKHKK